MVSETLHIWSANGEWDEDGFYFTIEDDNGDEHRFVVRDVATARKLLSAVSHLRPWIAEHNHERAAYDAATDEEREQALGLSEPPVEPGEALRYAADLERKARKERS